MKKIVHIFFTVIMIFTILIVYFYNDGWLLYNMQKKFLSPLKLVEYYCDVKFSTETKIKRVEFNNDSPNMFDEYLQIAILVPTNELNNLFEENQKNYDVDFAPNIFPENEKNSAKFYIQKYNTVRKWFTKTQRTMTFIVYETSDKYTKVNVLVDKLGWYLWNKWRL